jgi:hypothetical protein
MPRTPKTKDLGSLTAVANGTTVDVSYMYEFNKYVTIAGTFVGTVKIETSADGTNWVQEGADVTAPAVREVATRNRYLRMRCSAFTSGTITGSVYGVETTGQ